MEVSSKIGKSTRKVVERSQERSSDRYPRQESESRPIINLNYYKRKYQFNKGATLSKNEETPGRQRQPPPNLQAVGLRRNERSKKGILEESPSILRIILSQKQMEVSKTMISSKRNEKTSAGTALSPKKTLKQGYFLSEETSALKSRIPPSSQVGISASSFNLNSSHLVKAEPQGAHNTSRKLSSDHLSSKMKPPTRGILTRLLHEDEKKKNSGSRDASPVFISQKKSDCSWKTPSREDEINPFDHNAQLSKEHFIAAEDHSNISRTPEKPQGGLASRNRSSTSLNTPVRHHEDSQTRSQNDAKLLRSTTASATIDGPSTTRSFERSPHQIPLKESPHPILISTEEYSFGEEIPKLPNKELVVILSRTQRVLGVYREKEKLWVSEKSQLSSEISSLRALVQEYEQREKERAINADDWASNN